MWRLICAAQTPPRANSSLFYLPLALAVCLGVFMGLSFSPLSLAVFLGDMVLWHLGDVVMWLICPICVLTCPICVLTSPTCVPWVIWWCGAWYAQLRRLPGRRMSLSVSNPLFCRCKRTHSIVREHILCLSLSLIYYSVGGGLAGQSWGAIYRTCSLTRKCVLLL